MVALRAAPVRCERLLPAGPPLVTLPIVLIALLKFSEFAVHLFKARDGSSTWYFRFSPRAVLQVREDGDWCWRQGTQRWRREIAPFLARAEALLAEAGDDGGLAALRIRGRRLADQGERVGVTALKLRAAA
jgi:hypothetical protein